MKKTSFIPFFLSFLILLSATSFLYSQEALAPAFLLRYGDYLLNLVTKDNTLDRYTPRDLIGLSEFGAEDLYIRRAVYTHLQDLVRAMERENVPVKILSPYRSYDRQKSIYNYYKRTDEDADQFSAQAGHSEHQLGTTVDFGVGSAKFDFEDAFGETPQGRWLAEHAWEYGFAFSYPKDMQHITGFQYEPWHYRFIGLEAAREWYGSGLTLSEYLLTKPQYYVPESLFGHFVRGEDSAVYYISQNGYKRRIASGSVLASYGVTAKDTPLVESGILKEIPDAFLLRQEGDARVYFIDRARQLRWVTGAQIFSALGYKWEDIVEVNSIEFSRYRSGTAIDSYDAFVSELCGDDKVYSAHLGSCLAVIGSSVEGRAINIATFGSGPAKVLFIGGLHTGSEENTRILAEEMVSYFAKRPDAVPQNATLLIVPSANPDGTAREKHNNANGVDLNRNWPASDWRSDPYHPQYGRLNGAGGKYPLSEPETKAIYDFIQHEKPVMAFVWHSRAGLVEDNNVGVADAAAALYAEATKYLHIEEWDAYEVTGTFSHAMAEAGFPTAAIELTTYTDTEFERNIWGVRAVLDFLSK